MDSKGRKYNFPTRTRTKNISIHPKYGNMKKIAVLLLGFLIASSLSGCIGSDKNEENEINLMADFIYSPSSPSTQDVISFTDTSTDSDGNIVSWLWNFGDGYNSTQQNPTHKYTNHGNYTVSLIVTDNNGNTGTKTKQVIINPVAVIKTNMGTMKVELYDDKMPTTTKNFVKLANDGFYDGLVFHRVIKNFMIQGGGFYPNGTYKESPYGPIPLETNPDVTHVDGAISMARTSDPNSATSQFFICDGAQHYLDGQYAAFGKVIEGMEVVRAIASVETTTKHGMQDWPVDEVIIEHAAVLT
ncbi:MAG TPA: PKD domain-containing protein [Thermoplasmatales archaeon]|nr:PKD domain-containing protein [Thermoplasmatales archaeon]